MDQITEALNRMDEGQQLQSAEELQPLVYMELRRIAAIKYAHEAPGQTLQATALVHEVWIRLTRDEHRRWHGRTHFFAAAGEAMRRILIDNARRKRAARHGGALERVDLDASDVPIASPSSDEEELLSVHEALDRLAVLDSRKAEVVKLRYFVGLTTKQVAESLQVSEPTAKRDWAYARAWLFREIRRSE